MWKSEKQRIQIRQTLLIALIWTLLGFPIALYDDLLIKTFSKTSIEEYNFLFNALTNAAGGLISGLTVLPIYIFVLKKRFQRLPFLSSILLTTLFFVMAIALIYLIVVIGFESISRELPPWHPEVLQILGPAFFSPPFLRVELLWFLISTSTIFLIQVSEKYGQGILRDFLLGRYHQPLRDFRIFMFLDLQSSTTIAERLGDVRYFNFLSDFFADITDAIVNYKGKIYQYVGDEVVVSWSLKDGRLNDNCVRCFFEVDHIIERRRDYYEEQYGIRPCFKAGYHYGRATIGEIGLIKKDIVFSGDVLNTTARIQSLCNQHEAMILLSSDLHEQLPMQSGFQVSSIGELRLRGKAEPLELFKVEKSTSGLSFTEK